MSFCRFHFQTQKFTHSTSLPVTQISQIDNIRNIFTPYLFFYKLGFDIWVFREPGLCLTKLVFSPKVFIEQKALDTVAHLCDGDARAGLNGLQLAVQACVTQMRTGSIKPDAAPHQIIVREQHIKEGLQRSHILYDKAGINKDT